MSVKQILNRAGKTLSKNSPTILTGIAIAGTFTTAVLAVKATPRALQLLEDEEVRLDDNLTVKDKIRVCWRLYLPATGVGLATAGCIVAANTVNLRRNAALAGLYSITETAFKEYQNKVVETIGSNKERKVRDEVNQDRLDRNPSGANQIFITGKGKVLCYDKLCDRYFESDHETIRKAVNDINLELRDSMFVELNDLYYAIGLAPTGLGSKVGWEIDHGYCEAKFSTGLNENNDPCLVMDFDVYPIFA